MKSQIQLNVSITALAAGMMLTGWASAQAPVVPPVTQETTVVETSPSLITATGTVFSVEPTILSVVMKDSPTPVQFSYNISTPIVDEDGKVIPLELVRRDLPLTVDYSMEGEKMVAQKIVITRSMVAGDAGKKPTAKRAELAEANSKSGDNNGGNKLPVPENLIGTLATVEQTLSLVPRSGSDPVSCIINNSTRIVNMSGEPVSGGLLTSGMPLTVKTVKDGERIIATEIIVRGNPSTVTSDAKGRPNGAGNRAPGKVQPSPSTTPPTPSAR